MIRRIAVLGAWLVGAQAVAGVTMVMDRQGQVATVYLDGDKVRVEDTRGGRPVALIFDAAAQKAWMLDPGSKTYRVIDSTTGSQAQQAQQQYGGMASGQQATANDRLQAALAKMSPEQRAMVEQRMQGGAG